MAKVTRWTTFEHEARGLALAVTEHGEVMFRPGLTEVYSVIGHIEPSAALEVLELADKAVMALDASRPE